MTRHKATYNDIVNPWLHPPADETWKNDASCQNTTPTMWFPQREKNRAYSPETKTLTKLAKLICQECPVQPDCLIWALDTDQRWGIYGGLTEQERTKISGKRAE